MAETLAANVVWLASATDKASADHAKCFFMDMTVLRGLPEQAILMMK